VEQLLEFICRFVLGAEPLQAARRCWDEAQSVSQCVAERAELAKRPGRQGAEHVVELIQDQHQRDV
jgi:hypothetical protein